MRRLFAGVLVLLFTSFAQAGLITGLVFTANGEPDPDTVFLRPGEVVELGIELEEWQNIYCYNFDYVLSNNEAEFITDGASGSHTDLPPMTDIEFPAPFDIPGQLIINEPQHVQFAAAQVISPPLDGPQVLMQELYVTCPLAQTIVTITTGGETIIGGEVYPLLVQVHTLSIERIPEPTTMSILLLGSVFFLHRRRY